MPKRTQRKRTGKNTKFAQKVATNSTLSGPRVQPDELDVRLMFRKTENLIQGAGNLAIAEFTSNAAYDVDPTLGSTETYGFDEYAALYSYYRVFGYSYEVVVTNTTAQPAMAYVLNTNTRPSTSGTRWDLYSTNPYCQSKLLALSGAGLSSHTFRKKVMISNVLGSRAVETDDSYRALTTGVPVDLMWLGVGIENPTANVGVSCVYDLKLIMHVRFYGREVDLSLAGLAARLQRHLNARAESALKKKLLALPKSA